MDCLSDKRAEVAVVVPPGQHARKRCAARTAAVHAPMTLCHPRLRIHRRRLHWPHPSLQHHLVGLTARREDVQDRAAVLVAAEVIAAVAALSLAVGPKVN